MDVLPTSFLQCGVTLKTFIWFSHPGKVHVRLSQKLQKGNRRPSSKVIPLLSTPHGMSSKKKKCKNSQISSTFPQVCEINKPLWLLWLSSSCTWPPSELWVPLPLQLLQLKYTGSLPQQTLIYRAWCLTSLIYFRARVLAVPALWGAAVTHSPRRSVSTLTRLHSHGSHFLKSNTCKQIILLTIATPLHIS